MRRLAIALLLAACGEGVRSDALVQCDALGDTGCAEGEHCRLVEGGETICLARTSAGNSACGPGTCEPGAACLTVGGLKACRPLCTDDAECGGAPGTCSLEIAGVPDGGPRACAVPCALAAGCGRADAHCTIVGALPFPVCIAPGDAGEGDPCDEARCVAGMGCVAPPGGAAVCRRLCADDVPCGADLRCEGLLGGLPDVRYCIR